MNRSKIFFIIVNYNSGDRLDPCIASICNATESLPHENIIIVDNDSTDASLAFVRRAYPKLTYIATGQNRGFGSGVNVGIQTAKEKGAEQFLIINPDAVLDDQCVSILSKKLEEENVGMVAPVIYTTEDSPQIWFSGGEINWSRQRVAHWQDEPKEECRETPFVTGCVFGINRSFLDSVGSSSDLFDERFFLYYEDADLSQRAVTAGRKNYVLRGAKAYHEEQSNALGELKLYYLVLSGLLFFDKHMTGWRKLQFRLTLLMRKAFNTYNRLLKKAYAQTVYQALTDYGHARNTVRWTKP